jgi:hypothetical protein
MDLYLRSSNKGGIMSFKNSDISCNTEQIAIWNKNLDIRASATSDVLLTDECRHVQSRMLKLFRGYQFIPNDYCPKCGEKL